jgi:exonuclease SbcC
MNIFSRDGPVATSLRSWALNTISAKASEYLTLLNTKIQRIALSEKSRDISIACFSKNEVLELESLSGGEKVSVALALRLGMASLLGASNLNLMILDEPTTHLDAERKKSLVGVLSQLSNISSSETRMQFLIITHDAEIFEDSTVEQIYKFESTEQGSKVIEL